MATKKEGVLGQVSGLLEKFQRRLDQYGLELSWYDCIQEDQRKKFEAAVQQINAIAEKVSNQDTVNKEVATGLYNLRESTQKAFNNVQSDYAKLLESQQRLNERITKLESEQSFTKVAMTDNAKVIDSHNDRIAKLEEGLSAISTFANSAHSRLDKLNLQVLNVPTRDYDKVNTLETRVAAVEGIIRAAKVLLGLVGKV